MSRRINLALNGGLPLLAVQDRLIRSTARIRAIFGGYRSGKTRGCALALFANCLANPWTPEFGEDRPFSLVIGYTHKILVDSAYRELKAVIPKELVIKEPKSPSLELWLANGHVIKFRTAKGNIEGASACGVWLDEAHKLPDNKAYTNYQARASDVRTNRSLVLVSGLPERGWLEETFDKPEHRNDPDRLLLFASTVDNRYLQDHVIRNLRASVGAGDATRYIEGRWQTRPDIIFHCFSNQDHPAGSLWAWPGDKSRPVHLGFDIGQQGAIVVFQEVKRMCKRPLRAGGFEKREELGLHVVDELLPDNMSTREACRALKARGWSIAPKISQFFVDPTTRPDELQAIRDEFHGTDTRIVRHVRGDPQEEVEYGHDAVNAALHDADGNRRLTLFSGLPREKRSLLSVMHKYHRKNGRPVRDNVVDHVLDAFRYPVAHMLPIRTGA